MDLIKNIFNYLTTGFKVILIGLVLIILMPLNLISKTLYQNLSTKLTGDIDYNELIKKPAFTYTIAVYVVIIGLYIAFAPVLNAMFISDVNKNKEGEFINNITVMNEDVYIEEDIVPEELKNASRVEQKLFNAKFLAVLEIPKINIFQGIVLMNNSGTTIHHNVAMMRESSLPSIPGSNMSLAAHSGSSNIAYFKNAHKLEPGDYIYIHQKDTVYTYQVFKNYQVPDTDLSVLDPPQDGINIVTLITCHKTNNRVRIIIVARKLDTV